MCIRDSTKGEGNELQGHTGITYGRVADGVGLCRRPRTGRQRTCRGTIGSTTVDDLLVPQGATCTLDGTTVKGTITVKGDATLRAAHVRVVGNVQSENAKRVVLRGLVRRR